MTQEEAHKIERQFKNRPHLVDLMLNSKGLDSIEYAYIRLK